MDQVCGTSTPFIRQLIQELDQIVLKDGVLKRTGKEGVTGLEAVQVIIPKQETKDVWATYDEGMGHPTPKSRTTAYHPQVNGACERFNQTLLGLLDSLEIVDQAQWPSTLPALVQAYNNTVHSATGMTPYYVSFGRHARLPVDWLAGNGGPPRTRLGQTASTHTPTCFLGGQRTCYMETAGGAAPLSTQRGTSRYR